jgi:hypothetical protein
MKKLFTVCVLLSAITGAFVTSHAQGRHSFPATGNNTSTLLMTNHQRAVPSSSSPQKSFVFPVRNTLAPFSARTLVQIIDSSYKWSWDTTGNGWASQAYYKTTDILYDANYNDTINTQQIWNASAWENYQQQSHTYDAASNMTGEIFKYWTGSTWENSWQYIFTYDANNNETGSLSQEWYGSAWLNDYKTISTYDANNNCTNYLAQNWTGTEWADFWHYINTYDANNNMTGMVRQNWTGSSWVNAWQYSTMLYDGNNNLTLEIYQEWSGSAWVDKRKSEFYYDANNYMTGGLDLFWNGNAWLNGYMFTYTYDAGYNMKNLLGLAWDGSGWVNEYQYNYTYDANNFKVSDAYRSWNSAGTKVMTGDSVYYYFHTNVGINDLAAGNGIIMVYPNPTTSSIVIRADSRYERLTVYNPTGQAVYEQDFVSPETRLDLFTFSKGVYYIRLSGAKVSAVREVVAL